MRTSDEYPRMMFHRSGLTTVVLSRGEEEGLGRDWSRTLWPSAGGPAAGPDPVPVPPPVTVEPAPETETPRPAWHKRVMPEPEPEPEPPVKRTPPPVKAAKPAENKPKKKYGRG
jgi:hypothetical protein